MADIEDIIASAKRAEKTVRICVRGDLNARIDELEQQLEDAQGWKPATLAETSPVRGLAEQIEALRQEMHEHEHPFTFRALPPKEWSDLLAEHPAREVDTEAGYSFNVETFPTAVVSACAINPVMTVDQVQRLIPALNQGQWDDLFTTVWRVNVRATDIPFSLAASAALASTEQN